MKKLNILLINNIWPHPKHTIRAANIVIFELIKEMNRGDHTQVSYLNVSRQDDSIDENEKTLSIKSLQAANIKILDPLIIPRDRHNRNKWSKLLNPKLQDFYSETRWCHLVANRILKNVPDVIFIPWSEWVTALCADIKIPKFVYYGNPDFKSLHAQIELAKKHKSITKLQYYYTKLIYRKFERFHLDIMNKYEMVGNVAANDASYYSQCGHPNAFYIQNTWIDRFGEECHSMRKDPNERNTFIIIGNIGKLGGTANTYGLEYFADSIFPILQDKLKGLNYEVHMIGAGELIPAIRAKLDHPSIVFRGFVPDIDKELSSSSIVLCVNNGTFYKVGHTRYLHAWSLGCCVVAHEDVRLSMPEIEHDNNALLGSSPEDIVKKIYTALIDDGLRMRIGKQGYKTFKKYFLPEIVANRIIQIIRTNLQLIK